MALVRPTFCRLLQSMKLSKQQIKITRSSNTLEGYVLEKHRKQSNLQPKELAEERETPVPENLMYAFPEFVPSPMKRYQDTVMNQLERNDMFLRRRIIKLPEFYVGSLLAVTVADEYAPGKQNRFVGICIERGATGLRTWFTLRNVIENQGVEITYDLYNPVIANIEVLKLEKRLDNHLRYLRDAPLEYSQVAFDMVGIPLPEGSEVPVNRQKIKLKPKPWHERWERQELHGIENLTLNFSKKKHWRRYNMVKEETTRNKYDLMKQYRETADPEITGTAMRDLMRNKKKLN